jgi:hypothetical protein
VAAKAVAATGFAKAAAPITAVAATGVAKVAVPIMGGVGATVNPESQVLPASQAQGVQDFDIPEEHGFTHYYSQVALGALALVGFATAGTRWLRKVAPGDARTGRDVEMPSLGDVGQSIAAHGFVDAARPSMAAAAASQPGATLGYFDPLGSKDFKNLRAAEFQHGRVAVAAVSNRQYGRGAFSFAGAAGPTLYRASTAISMQAVDPSSPMGYLEPGFSNAGEEKEGETSDVWNTTFCAILGLAVALTPLSANCEEMGKFIPPQKVPMGVMAPGEALKRCAVTGDCGGMFVPSSVKQAKEYCSGDKKKGQGICEYKEDKNGNPSVKILNQGESFGPSGVV